MALPRKLKYLNMFNDGLSYMGVVESVTLPKLTRKLEKYRGGGMPGSVSVDLGLDDDALALEWTVGGLPDAALWAQYASPGADSVPLRFTGSFQRDDTGEISASKLSCAAVIKSLMAARTSRAKAAPPRCPPSARTTS